MIRLAGLRQGRDIDIVYTGLRPGEKLYEEPLHASEELEQTEIRAIRRARPRTADYALLRRVIDQLVIAALSKDNRADAGDDQPLGPGISPGGSHGHGFRGIQPPASGSEHFDRVG